MNKEAPTKRRLFKRNEKGQLSIFLGICMTVILTMLAFIVNIGLFVKAKINLQNAVDAAAWSGAAVQARQLSNIGYMNWELRNTYKEWLFKYYVLGHMGQDWLKYPNLGSQPHDFLLKPFGMDTPDVRDKFNLPSICIHFGSPNNICSIYDVPGLPEFDTVGLPGISERHSSFLASIRDIKSKDCSERGGINLMTTLLWAYGTGSSSFSDLPSVAANRIGAWIEAIEIGFRIRNLESFVNRPPVNGGMCVSGPCPIQLGMLQSEFQLPYNERPIKALISAYRNLGGGTIKDEEENEDNMDIFTRSFSLTEIPPSPHEVQPTSLSGLLIPADATVAGQSAFSKNYLDLLAFPINMATLYTNFVTKSGTV
ncbi:MAG: Tad domain-containing protein, partial [Bacteriovoracaceae bacterium]|nr:Tad domain-containing protein [Bacteriovoracaceae bacterium]